MYMTTLYSGQVFLAKVNQPKQRLPDNIFKEMLMKSLSNGKKTTMQSEWDNMNVYYVA